MQFANKLNKPIFPLTFNHQLPNIYKKTTH